MTATEVLRILENKDFCTRAKREYNTAIAALQNPGRKFRCGKNIKVGENYTSVSWLREIVQLFDRLDFHEYSYGNDAPRKGRHGDFIIVISKL